MGGAGGEMELSLEKTKKSREKWDWALKSVCCQLRRLPWWLLLMCSNELVNGAVDGDKMNFSEKVTMKLFPNVSYRCVFIRDIYVK